MDIRKELKSLQTTESNIEALEECAEEYEKIFGAGNEIGENCRLQRIRKRNIIMRSSDILIRSLMKRSDQLSNCGINMGNGECSSIWIQ